MELKRVAEQSRTLKRDNSGEAAKRIAAGVNDRLRSVPLNGHVDFKRPIRSGEGG